VSVHGENLRVLKRHAVRVVPADALRKFASPNSRAKFEADFGRIPIDFSRQLLSVLGIANAAEKHDFKQVAILAERAVATAGKSAVAWSKLNAVLSPWDKVTATLNTGIHGAFPVVWQRGSQLIPALLCRSPQTALFAHALFAVTGKYGLGYCRRCGNPFFASRAKQSYCSYRCRVAEGMKRYRKSPKYLKGRTRGRKGKQ
jgi:hypothetical protein